VCLDIGDARRLALVRAVSGAPRNRQCDSRPDIRKSDLDRRDLPASRGRRGARTSVCSVATTQSRRARLAVDSPCLPTTRAHTPAGTIVVNEELKAYIDPLTAGEYEAPERM